MSSPSPNKPLAPLMSDPNTLSTWLAPQHRMHVVSTRGCDWKGLKVLLVAEVMDVSVDGRSTIMEMIYQFASTRNHRLALGPHLIGASDTSMVCADNTSIADSDLYSKR